MTAAACPYCGIAAGAGVEWRGLTVNRGIVFYCGEKCSALPAKQARMLTALVRARGQEVDDEVFEGILETASTSALRWHAHRLREWLETEGPPFAMPKKRQRCGYRLVHLG